MHRFAVTICARETVNQIESNLRGIIYDVEYQFTFWASSFLPFYHSTVSFNRLIIPIGLFLNSKLRLLCTTAHNNSYQLALIKRALHFLTLRFFYFNAMVSIFNSTVAPIIIQDASVSLLLSLTLLKYCCNHQTCTTQRIRDFPIGTPVTFFSTRCALEATSSLSRIFRSNPAVRELFCCIPEPTTDSELRKWRRTAGCCLFKPKGLPVSVKYNLVYNKTNPCYAARQIYCSLPIRIQAERGRETGRIKTHISWQTLTTMSPFFNTAQLDKIFVFQKNIANNNNKA